MTESENHDIVPVGYVFVFVLEILKQSDIVLSTSSDETKYNILALNSRIAQLAIFDALYTYIVMNSNKAAVKAIKETETALQSKKY